MRKEILKQSASFGITHTDKLLKLSSEIDPIDTTDGPSTQKDDFSLADTIRNVSEDIPWHLLISYKKKLKKNINVILT